MGGSGTQRLPRATEGGPYGLGFEEAPQEDAQEEAQEALEEDALGTPAQEVATLRSTITFSSDYGPTDEFVGVCRAVMLRIAPDARVIDIAHGIADVRSGAAVLAQSLVYAPRGVHLAVVDPGVGTARRGVVIRAADGSCLVGPDNGLLVPAAGALGGAREAYELADARYRLAVVDATFHGRDVFAPAAAYLSLGTDPSRFGPRVPLDELVPSPVASTSSGPGVLRSDVLRADHFGNLQLAATASDLVRAQLRGRVVVSSPGRRRGAVMGRTFADAAPGRLVVYLDAGGHVAVACNGGSAANLLGSPERVRIAMPRGNGTGSARTRPKDTGPRPS